MSPYWPTVTVACVFIVAIVLAVLFMPGSAPVAVTTALTGSLGVIGVAIAAAMERAFSEKK